MCLAQLRALGVQHLCSFFAARQRTNQEIRFRQAEIASLLVRGREHRASRGRKHCAPKADAFGNCAVRRSEKRTAERQRSASLPHLGRISARPRWVSLAKAFTFSFCLKFHLSQRKRQKLTSFAKAKSEQLPCRCFCLKHRRKS